MTPIHEQIADIQRQIDALAQQVAVLASQSKRESPAKNQPDNEGKPIGIRRYRALHGKA